MKIAAFSDNHGILNFKVPDCDLLLIAGDMCGSSKIPLQRRYLDTEFRQFLQEIVNRGIPIIGTPGNHELIFESDNQTDKDLIKSLPCKFLIDETIEFEGLIIHGTPATPIFFNWAFNYSHEELVEKFKKIPENFDILISHGPPLGILDLNIRGEYCGSRALRNRLFEIWESNRKSTSCVTGHIHESYGFDSIGNSRLFNVSLTNHLYHRVNKVTTFEI